MRSAILVISCCLLGWLNAAASAEVVKVEVRKRVDEGRYERVIARVAFAIDPQLPPNQPIADLALAPRNPAGLVEFSGDVMIVRAKDAKRANGSVLLEVVNRGRDQSLGLMNGAASRSALPEAWDLGDRFALERGFTLVFVGWQFDVASEQGLGLRVPSAPVRGRVRTSAIEAGTTRQDQNVALSYCAADPRQSDAQMTFRSRIDAPPAILPRVSWQFSANGCLAHVDEGLAQGLYEVIYDAEGSPVAGLGFAAVRDVVSYLKHGAAGAPLRENPAVAERVIGFGYSQSGRFLRDFVRDGFNADEHGREVFDGLMIAAAGAGGGSFNHRFAMPGQAGNSVLSILRPVDVPPFTDDGLLAAARTSNTVPKIFYTLSSSDYWARAGSLTHTTDDGTRDVPLAETSRLYFLSGTPHSGGPFPPSRLAAYLHEPNFADQRWTMRALVVDLDAWIRSGTAPPASTYPTIAKHELVPREAVTFPIVEALAFPAYMPQVWRTDYGKDFSTSRVITQEPPVLGAPYVVLVPQVDADGNDVGGVHLPELAVPLGTFTGWNVSVPALPDLRYLAGLIGSFEPFARTRRDRTRDARPSIADRYPDKEDYLARVSRAIDDLIRQRFALRDDRQAMLRRASAMWDAVVGEAGRQ